MRQEINDGARLFNGLYEQKKNRCFKLLRISNVLARKFSYLFSVFLKKNRKAVYFAATVEWNQQKMILRGRHPTKVVFVL